MKAHLNSSSGAQAGGEQVMRPVEPAYRVDTPEVMRLLEQQELLIKTGNALADRALYTSREYDGLHRLASAVATWIDTVAKLHLAEVTTAAFENLDGNKWPVENAKEEK